MKFHHAFVFAAPNAPAADRLAEAGLSEGSANIHPGQGTCNRRFFFKNGMIEFLWVCDEEEVRSPPIALTRLWERSRRRESGTCPFGVAFELEKGKAPPFPTWDYRPPYLPEHVFIQVAEFSKDPALPFVFVMPAIHAKRMEPGNERRVESLIVESLKAPAPFESGLVRFARGDDVLMELRLEGAKQTLDLRPEVPLVIEY